jgi:hypothetical protein
MSARLLLPIDLDHTVIDDAAAFKRKERNPAPLDVDGRWAHGVPVTTAPEPEPEMPWLQPTTELPAQPTSRRRIIVLLLPVVGLLVLCCGGAALSMSVFHGNKPKAAGPTMVIPSSSAPEPAPTTESPSPTPSPSPSPTTKTPTTHPTTHRPRPTTAKPTTTKPKPSPSAPGGVQRNVRLGEFCGPRGALGITRRGQVLRCGPSIDDPRDRWRPMV